MPRWLFSKVGSCRAGGIASPTKVGLCARRTPLPDLAKFDRYKGKKR
jgi:hypothetical protein